MKAIGIITNRDKDIGLKYTGLLVNSIRSKGGTPVLPGDIAKELTGQDRDFSTDDVVKSSDVIISLGGDGTFLNAARKAYRHGVPLMGVNLGRLGFLTEVEKGDIDKSVENIIRGDYRVEERMMLECSVIKKDGSVIIDEALNDVVISRGALSRIIHLNTYIDNVFMDMFPGDGVIVSSPTGSTAYSLSAGGPIVDPETSIMIITSICPHILYSRSFITTVNHTIRVEVDRSCHNTCMVTVDGQAGYEIMGGDNIEIRKSPNSVKMVRIHSKNFYSILRTKIYDRGEALSSNEV